MKVEHPSVCPLDCPDTCSLTVTVEDERIVSIRGSRANPYTAGVLCAKVPEAYPGFVHGEGRLKTPLRRVGAKGEGRFEPISWSQALDIVHERFAAVIAAHGPQAILPLNYAGPHGMLAGGSMDLRFFHRLGASLLDRRPLCGGIRTEAWVGTFGPVPGIRPEQAEHSKLIVAWGSNVTWSNLHFVPIINRARRAGGKLVVVDTRRTKIAEQADLHIALRPGTDVVLAWAMAAELECQGGLDRAFIERHVAGFEEYMALARRYTMTDAARICGVDESKVRQLVEWYRTLSPAVITLRHRLRRNRKRGLAREALFVVGSDVVMTDSLAYADAVLPACSHFEHADLFAAYGTHWLQRAEPVIPPQGEALPNTEIFRRLAARFGFTDPAFRASDAELMDDALDGGDARLGGKRPSAVPLDRALAMTVGGEDAMLFTNVFPKTASGKVELASPYLEGKYGARLPSWRPVASSYPLTLISPASDQRITSTFGGLHVAQGPPPLEMHPDDARARSLRDGMRVRVWNDLGEVRLALRVTDVIPRGVVCTLKGAWMATSDNGQTISALCPADHADISEGACYNDARVEVAAL